MLQHTLLENIKLCPKIKLIFVPKNQWIIVMTIYLFLLQFEILRQKLLKLNAANYFWLSTFTKINIFAAKIQII